jgi:alginate O-acetyltransferase complex protein AlgJ
MGLLSSHRRHLGAVVVAILVLVMIGALAPDPTGAWRPFDLPRSQMSFSAWLGALPAAVSRYVTNNFGYGRSMPLLRGVIAYTLGSSSNPRVFIGQRSHLFYNAENVVGQSTGSIYRTDEVGHFVDMAEALQQALAPWGGRLVVMLPPNAQSVAKEDLPPWWHLSGPLEYDLAIRELRQRGITAIDMKTALTAVPDPNDLYRRSDSHWRENAALMAFNMTLQAAGHPDWRLDPATSLLPLTTLPGGDLARLIGLQDYLTDSDYVWRESPAQTGWRAIDVLHAPPFSGVFFSFAFERAPEGARILVLGDSFTADASRQMLPQTGAARIGWMHHANCSFDFNDVVRFQPTLVILAPAERYMPCPLKNWPQGLPRR